MKDIKDWMPEFKVSAESDRDLMRYFLKTSILEDLVTTDKWMVIGRKGTGKTAIYEYLKNTEPNDLNGYSAVPLNFKDYPWPIQKLYKDGMESEISSYQRSWKYIIIIKCLGDLIEKTEKMKSLPNDLKSAKDLLSKIYGTSNPGIIEIIKSKIFRLKSLTLPNADFGEISLSLGGIELDDVAQNEELKRSLRSNAFALLNYFEEIYKKNIGEIRQMVIIDQLDENWLQGEIQEYSKILINLIICAQNINNDQFYSKKLKVSIFLRADIYETLRFNDKNKVYQDGAIEVKWSYDSLDAMFSERIRQYCPSGVIIDINSEKSASIFEKKTVRHGVTPLKHILRRSFYRPRDVIVYFNKIRAIHEISKNGLYVSKDLYNAESLVSSSMYDELIDEWGNQKPDMESYLTTLQNIGLEIFTRENYFQKYKEINSEATDAIVNEILRFLFANSIIGQKQNVNWEYVCTNPHIQIKFEKPFHVNNGLKDRLVLKENRTRK